MSTQVDDLQIKLTAEARTAESAVDSLIGKLSTLQTILRGTIRSTSRMGSDVSKATNGIANKMGVSGLKETKAQIEQMQKPLITFKEKIEQVRKSLGNLGSDYANKGGKFDTAERINKEIEKIEAKLYNLEQNAGLKKFGSEAYNNLIEKGALLSNQLDSLKQKLAELKGADESFGKEKVEPETQEQVNSAAVSFNNLDSAMSKIASKVSIASVFKTIKSAIADTISIVEKAAIAFNKFARIVGSPVDNAFKKLGETIRAFSVKNIGLVKNLTRVLKMLKLMITRMALRGVISEVKTSFGELAQFSDKVANAYNKIRNAVKYLADSLAALVAPILNSGINFRGLGDVIDAVADKIVALVNKINQLVSALTGKSTWIQAQKQQKNYAASMDKTSKSAKKLNKQLAAFDELNNLTTSENTGNNNDTGTGGSQFKEQPIDPKYLKMAEWLKDMWKKGDGYELGRAIGEWLRDALNSIPWGKIQNFARRLGSFLATTLNGFFETPGLAKAIGNTIASAINTALIFAEEFISKFHFDSFGKFIGEAISEAIKGIHWTRLQNACKMLGAGIATAINSLAETGVLRQIGTAIGNLLLAAINFAFSLITNIKWDVLGEELNAGIQNLLSKMAEVDETNLNGWQKLAITISDAVKGALTAINKVLGDPKTRKMIGDAITDFFNSFDYSGIKEAFKELAFNIAKLLAQATFSAFKSGNFRDMLGDIGTVFKWVLVAKILKGIASFGTSIISTALGVALGQAIRSGAAAAAVKSAGVAVMEMFTTMAAGAKTAALAVGGAMKSVVAAIGSAVTSITMFMTADISTLLAAGGATAGAAMGTAIVGGAAAALAGAEFGKKVVGPAIFPDDAELYAEYSGIKGTFALIKDTVVTFSEETSDKLGGIMDKITNKVSDSNSTMGKAIGLFGETVVSGVKAKFDFVKGVFTGGLEFIVQDTKNSINATISALKLFGATLGNLLKSGWEGIKNTFTNISKFVTQVVQDAMNKLSELKQRASDAFNDTALGKVANFFFRQNAGGGIYSGGRWKPIQSYASGGIVNSAEMFIARENGAPEMVGQIGGHTAVANNDQIVASIESGVFRAVKAAMGSGGGGTQTVQVEVIPDKDNLFNVIRKQGNDYQRRTGNPVWA